jgi:hypothetical protein
MAIVTQFGPDFARNDQCEVVAAQSVESCRRENEKKPSHGSIRESAVLSGKS